MNRFCFCLVLVERRPQQPGVLIVPVKNERLAFTEWHFHQVEALSFNRFDSLSGYRRNRAIEISPMSVSS